MDEQDVCDTIIKNVDEPEVREILIAVVKLPIQSCINLICKFNFDCKFRIFAIRTKEISLIYESYFHKLDLYFERLEHKAMKQMKPNIDNFLEEKFENERKVVEAILERCKDNTWAFGNLFLLNKFVKMYNFVPDFTDEYSEDYIFEDIELISYEN